MSTKKFLFLLVFLLIISVNGVNAEDNSLSDLRFLVDESNDTVNLDRDYEFVQTDSEDGVFIDKDIKIYGNNHAINGLNSSTLLHVSNCNVYMENINFLNAGNSALKIIDSNIVIKNCTFINNNAMCGGAISFERNCNGVIDNSLFFNNSAYKGAAIMVNTGESNLNVSNSIFNNNAVPTNLVIENIDGEARLFSNDNILDNQMYYIEDNLYGYYSNISFVNVSYNDFKNQSFNIKKGDFYSFGLENKTISFEVCGDGLLINTTNTTNHVGVAAMDYAGLALGNYTLKVSYNTLSDTKEIMVRKDSNFSIAVEDIYFADDLIIYFNITENATGKGHFAIWYNDTTYDEIYDWKLPYYHPEPIFDGEFNLNDTKVIVPYLEVGNHLLSVSYSGDDCYKSKDIHQVFTVYPIDYNKTGMKTILNASDFEKYYGDNKRLELSLTDENNNPLSNKIISINVNGIVYNKITDNSGKISMAINLNSGYYTFVASFKGDDVYLPAAEISTITIQPTIHSFGDMSMYLGDGSKYKVECKDNAGNTITDNAVEFNINGVKYYRSNFDESGYASLNINLAQGNYTITAINPVTGEMTSNLIEVLPLIKNNHDLVKFYKNDSQFSVQIDGILPIENNAVIFNINGVFYQRTADENGIAKLNINLAPGEYIITSEFNGCRVSNKITVLPILKAVNMKMSYRDGSTFNATLIDGNGNPLANTNVTFNINGVFYQRTTDENGIARLNINLMKGEYIITSSYNGSNIANKITIV